MFSPYLYFECNLLINHIKCWSRVPITLGPPLLIIKMVREMANSFYWKYNTYLLEILWGEVLSIQINPNRIDYFKKCCSIFWNYEEEVIPHGCQLKIRNNGEIFYVSVFDKGRFLVPVVIALAVRLLLIFIQEQTQLFGMTDFADYKGYLLNYELYQTFGYAYFHKYAVFGLEGALYIRLFPGFIWELFGMNGLWLIRTINVMLSLFVLYPLFHKIHN